MTDDSSNGAQDTGIDSTRGGGEFIGRRTRRQTKQSIALSKLQDTFDNDVGVKPSEEEDVGSPPPPRKKQRKSLGKKATTTVTKTPKVKFRGNRGKLADLMRMPVDIFVEISTYLMPIDLLRLARTSKFLRSLLMTKNMQSVWKQSLSLINGLPACPKDLSEPEYTDLLFENVCQRCGSSRPRRVDFVIRLRVCTLCFPLCTITHRDLRSHTDAEFLEPLLAGLIDRRVTYFNRAAFTELERALRALGDDDNARKKFHQERLEQLEIFEKHAHELDTWRTTFGARKYHQNREVTQRRRASILLKLAELGWDQRNVDDVPRYAINERDRNFHKLMDQPKDLTPQIWMNIQRKLIFALEYHKAARLERERRDRLKKLLHTISKTVKILARESQQRGEHGRMDATYWMWTFPMGDGLFTLPSIRPLWLDDTSDITQETIREYEADILKDVEIYQMNVRRFLVMSIVEAKAEESDSEALSYSTEPDTVDIETLKAMDEGNISTLMDPAAFFHSPSTPKSIWNYPGILKNYIRKSQVMFEEDRQKILSSVEASAIANAIIKSSPSIAALDRTVSAFDIKGDGSCFVCICCPESLRKHYSWRELVMHMMDEAKWYETTIQRRANVASGRGNPLVQILDDHAYPQAALLDREGVLEHSQLVKEALKQDDFADKWKCRHCSRAQGRKGELMLHLKTKHGIEGDDAEGSLKVDNHCYPSQAYKDETDWVDSRMGCPCNECNYYVSEKDYHMLFSIP